MNKKKIKHDDLSTSTLLKNALNLIDQANDMLSELSRRSDLPIKSKMDYFGVLMAVRQELFKDINDTCST